MRTAVIDTAPAALQALNDLSDWAETLDIAVAWASSSRGTAPHWKWVQPGLRHA